MGSFPEDWKIDIFKLIKLWVAEGFLRPSKNKILEEIAEEYLTDLIERNLILVSATEWSGKPISCKIHDLLRDLCLREAQKEKFLYVTSQHQLNIVPLEISTQRRIAIFESTSNEEYRPQVLHALESGSLARSLITYFGEGFSSLGFRLLRILKAFDSRRSYGMADILQLTNSRYIDVTRYWNPIGFRPSSIHLLWNLQTLILRSNYAITIALFEFWMMPLLRHVQVNKLLLPNNCSDQMYEQGDFVMENLQTLETIYNFKITEEVVQRIPNIKRLAIHYEDIEGFEVASHYCLNNLVRLHKLESLECYLHPLGGGNLPCFQNNMSFPNSLKELCLCYWSLDPEEINENVGSLPFLQN